MQAFTLIDSNVPFIGLEGVTYPSHFTGDDKPVMARPNLPKLTFSGDLPLENVKVEVERWNTFLKDRFKGAGYYGADLAGDVENPGSHNFIIFADESFAHEYEETLVCITVDALPSVSCEEYEFNANEYSQLMTN